MTTLIWTEALMRKRPSIILLFGLFSIHLFIASLLAQEVVKSKDGRQVFLKFEPDVTEMARETQQISHEAGGINTVWWLPEEFWKAALAANPNPTPPQTKIFVQEMFLKVVHPYFIVGVSSGKVGPFGAITYRTEAEVRGLVQLKDNEGSIYEPLPEDKLDSSMLALLDAMKPTLAKTGALLARTSTSTFFLGARMMAQESATLERKAPVRWTWGKGRSSGGCRWVPCCRSRSARFEVGPLAGPTSSVHMTGRSWWQTLPELWWSRLRPLRCRR